MIKIRVVPYGIPQAILESDQVMQKTEASTIKLSRVPTVGEYLVWRNQSFKITRVTHFSESYTYTAEIEMEWGESL